MTKKTTPIPQGYKQTKIGVLPVEWEVKKLQQISRKIMVGIASSATHAYQDDGIVLLRNQNIKSGHLDDTSILYVNEEYEKAFKNKRLQENDLLTCRTGYPGTTCLVPKKYENAQSFTTLITRLKPGISHQFVMEYINSPKGDNFFERSQIGGGQKNVGAPDPC